MTGSGRRTGRATDVARSRTMTIMTGPAADPPPRTPRRSARPRRRAGSRATVRLEMWSKFQHEYSLYARTRDGLGGPSAVLIGRGIDAKIARRSRDGMIWPGAGGAMEPNMIGAYGPWAASLAGEGPARVSVRGPRLRGGGADPPRA